MRNRVVMYSVTGVVAMGLIAAAAFKSRHLDSGATAVAPVAPSHTTISKHAVAKVVHPGVRPAVAAVEVDTAAGPLPKSYRVLLSHSLFSATPTTAPDQAAVPAEAELTLRGVLQRNRAYVACIENTASHQSQEVNIGESVGLGKIVSMDLNGVRYAAPGRNMRIEVGQTFRGARKVATAETSSMTTFRQITE